MNDQGLLERILDLGSEADEEPDLRVRKRAAVATALAFMAISIAIGILDVVLGRTVAAALSVVQIVAFGIALVMFGRSHRLAPLVVVMAVVGLTVLFVSLFQGGGLMWAASNLVWIILVPLATVLLLGRRAAIPALAGVVLVVAAAIVFNPWMQQEPPEPSTARLMLNAFSIIGPAAIALGLVVFIDGERVRAKAESEALLLNVLPRPIVERLKHGELVIADHYDNVTVLFADVVDFTPFAARETPARVVALLNEIFSGFDSLAARFELEKIKTIGDAYMLVCGAPQPRLDHAALVLAMALEMHALADSIESSPGETLRLRTGIASGAAVAGVIGHQKFSYDLWGDAVNLASRMESTGVPGCIQVASSTWEQCRDRYPFSPRDVEVKGLGSLRTYLLDPQLVRGAATI